MNLPIDIEERLEKDFLESQGEAIKILENSVFKNEYLNHPRIIRCIIFLANKDLNGLKRSIHQAKLDKRDVILFAEYINRKEDETLKRVRDFNKSFEESEKNIRE
jgi:hypothetical protein